MNRFTYIFSSAIIFVFCATSVQSQILTEIYCGHLLNIESGGWIRNAFIISKVMDFFSMICLLSVGFILELNYLYFFGCLSATFLMVYKYVLITPEDLSKMGIAFLRINAFVSTSMLLGTLLAII